MNDSMMSDCKMAGILTEVGGAGVTVGWSEAMQARPTNGERESERAFKFDWFMLKCCCEIGN